MIHPHGGMLVDRTLSGRERQDAFENAHALPRIELSERGVADLECIATGVYSPLEGFMPEHDYTSVIDQRRLPSGVAWTIPVALQVDEDRGTRVPVDAHVALALPDGDIVATMLVTSKYRPSQAHEAHRVFRTTDQDHPGVATMFGEGPVYLGGPVTLVADIPHDEFLEYRLTPRQTRAAFEEREWNTVVAFQTRNPIHRAHEYITKTALELVDGLMIQPLVGGTKADDIPADVRMQCYLTLIEHYYPKARVMLATFPAAMRYAGPMEAIMHSIARQNYGCTHFIVGRDHAGVGGYYGTYDAQKAFDEFSPDELAISPLRFDNAFFCTRTGQMATEKTSPSTPEERLSLSGTKLRAMLAAGEIPPEYVTRPEVAKVLMAAMAIAR
ncbi:MAG: sulfate adenylyltransferase [Candidatus Eremiobacteraeota bacterium]|nr:sulfate adenylyltransferase [Candidatus Eremiobacteraeota bacterium]